MNRETIFFKNNEVHPALRTLFSLLAIDHEGTVESIVSQGQKYLLRPAGVERWSIDASKYEQYRSDILSCLEALGFIRACEPAAGIYDYMVIFGFVTMDVTRHFDFIDSYLSSKSIHINHVVLLSSALPLPALHHAYGIEAAFMQELFQNSLLAHYPCTLINVSMTNDTTDAGVVRRATTRDTIVAWLQKNPVPGAVLALSGQPCIYRQARILQELLLAPFSITPCGPNPQEGLSIAIYLDELARALYEDQLMLTSAQNSQCD